VTFLGGGNKTQACDFPHIQTETRTFVIVYRPITGLVANGDRMPTERCTGEEMQQQRTQQHKLRALQRLGINSSNVTNIPIQRGDVSGEAGHICQAYGRRVSDYQENRQNQLAESYHTSGSDHTYDTRATQLSYRDRNYRLEDGSYTQMSGGNTTGRYAFEETIGEPRNKHITPTRHVRAKVKSLSAIWMQTIRATEEIDATSGERLRSRR